MLMVGIAGILSHVGEALLDTPNKLAAA